LAWLERLASGTARLVGTKGAVLCFHGLDVGEPLSAPSMHIPLHQFEAIVDAFGKLGSLVPLQEMVTRHVAGKTTAGLVALTADDAYASWLTAEPFLSRNDVPLTIFAVSDAMKTGPTFWWDRLDESASRAEPARWRRFEDECGLPMAYRQSRPASEGLMRPLRQWVLAEHAGRWPARLDDLLTQFENELGHRTHQRSMTGEELEKFLEHTGAQVGVHTVSHAALPFLPDDQLVDEVRQGYDQLRARFSRVLPYLAIPFGLFDPRTLRLAAQAGMTVSLTLEGQPLDRPFAADIGMSRLCVVREQAPGMLTLKLSGAARLISRLRGGADNPYPDLPSPST
jgi:peptidoglycan/xylan/chitin deacetylase (PgdA/CDA1 family)